MNLGKEKLTQFIQVMTDRYGKTIKTISEPFPQFLAEKFEYYEGVISGVKSYERSLTELENKFKADKKRLKEQYDNILSWCDHPVTTYQGDPAGGSDSITFCDICGKVI